MDKIDHLQISEKIELDLRDCYFDDKFLKHIKNMFNNSRSIKELILWFPCNYFTDDGLIELFFDFERF